MNGARHVLGKSCKRCGSDAWYMRSPKGKPQCAPCNQRWQKAQREDPIRGPEKKEAKKRYLRAYRERPEYAERAKVYRERAKETIATRYYTFGRFATYGLTLDQFHARFEAQGECCKICRDVMTKVCVDHQHDTRRVRGLLCDLCNKGLGQFRDNPDVLRRAAAYVAA